MADTTIESVGVLGAGTMGHGIAQLFAQSGFRVYLFDSNEQALERGVESIRRSVAKLVEKGKLTEKQRIETLERLAWVSILDAAVRASDLVIEAVPENAEIKRVVYQGIAPFLREGAIVATNTSSLSISGLAGSFQAPDRFIGMHFFNPPVLMKLIELVVGERTSRETVEEAKAVAARLGKETIAVRDFPGFATSRLGIVLGLEAMRMLETGVASAEEIDRAMELGYNHPMGPLRLTDLVGLDVRLAIAEALHAEYGQDQYKAPQILRRLVRAGKLGRKTGEGFYLYPEKG